MTIDRRVIDTVLLGAYIMFPQLFKSADIFPHFGVLTNQTKKPPAYLGFASTGGWKKM